MFFCGEIEEDLLGLRFSTRSSYHKASLSNEAVQDQHHLSWSQASCSQIVNPQSTVATFSHSYIVVWLFLKGFCLSTFCFSSPSFSLLLSFSPHWPVDSVSARVDRVCTKLNLSCFFCFHECLPWMARFLFFACSSLSVQASETWFISTQAVWAIFPLLFGSSTDSKPMHRHFCSSIVFPRFWLSAVVWTWYICSHSLWPRIKRVRLKTFVLLLCVCVPISDSFNHPVCC